MNVHFYLKLLFSLKITKINKVTCEELINDTTCAVLKPALSVRTYHYNMATYKKLMMPHHSTFFTLITEQENNTKIIL